ncbi:hypothetical protein BS17DRAFT_581187 [Gyrodon lividus]|nr:hypothetical protein BS17DRAFT_581187 [Gyrodon lividus]
MGSGKVSKCARCHHDQSYSRQGDASVRDRRPVQLVDSRCDKLLFPAAGDSERCDTPQSGCTVFFDAMEMLDASRSIIDTKPTNAGDDPSGSTPQAQIQAPGENSQFDLPSFRLERPSPDTSSIAPSSPASLLLFSGTHCASDYDYDGDDFYFPATPSPLARKGRHSTESRRHVSISYQGYRADRWPLPVCSDRISPGECWSANEGYLNYSRTACHSNKLFPPNLPRPVNPPIDDPAAISREGPTSDFRRQYRAWGRLCKETLRKNSSWLRDQVRRVGYSIFSAIGILFLLVECLRHLSAPPVQPTRHRTPLELAGRPAGDSRNPVREAVLFRPNAPISYSGRLHKA